MNRPMFLSMAGWYSSNAAACRKEIQSHINNEVYIEGFNPVSAIVPHAGWYFCGDLAVNTIRLLKEKNGDIEQVFIFGGHLSEIHLPIIETFDFAETPFGNLENNKAVVDFLLKNFNIQPIEFHQDNTVEILLPIVKLFFGNVKISSIYLPPNLKIIDMIEKLYNNFNYRSVFIGSTDLTHYGDNYNFYHHDKSIEPIKWVKEVNDKKYVDLLLSMDGEKSVDYALKNHSACSPGAALGAIITAKKKNKTIGKLMGYSTSYDVRKDSSFVGYTGIIY